MVTSHANVLRLVPKRRSADDIHVERDHVDFVVDGASLIDRVSELCGYEEDLVTVLNDFADDRRNSRLEQLIGKASPELPEKRTPLLECPECGAVECGVISAVIERAGDRIIWRDFGYEPSDHLPSGDRVDLGSLKALGPFEFEWDDYLTQFEAAADVLRDMPPRAPHG